MDLNTSFTIESASDDGESNSRSWKAFADQINNAWRKSAEDFIECGRLLSEANDELPRDAFNAMVKCKLDFASSVARKLICVATNETLCSPGNKFKLPPAWTILYQLSQLPEGTLKAALVDGRVHPGMSRKDAIALKPAKKTTATKSTAAKPSAAAPAELNLDWWNDLPLVQRRAFLDLLGREGLCTAMSPTLLADLRDHVVGLAVAGASNSTNFARYGTDKLHAALYCAKQPEPDMKRMAALLNCITKIAGDKGIARSDIVIAEGKPKSRK